jgi:cytochrome b561
MCGVVSLNMYSSEFTRQSLWMWSLFAVTASILLLVFILVVLRVVMRWAESLRVGLVSHWEEEIKDVEEAWIPGLLEYVNGSRSS